MLLADEAGNGDRQAVDGGGQTVTAAKEPLQSPSVVQAASSFPILRVEKPAVQQVAARDRPKEAAGQSEGRKAEEQAGKMQN